MKNRVNLFNAFYYLLFFLFLSCPLWAQTPSNSEFCQLVKGDNNQLAAKHPLPIYKKSGLPVDSIILEKQKEIRIPIVQNISDLFVPKKGLFNRNIALWHSHGWYYNNHENRWDWQRARLFGTVEDKYTMSYVLPYLLPMLENAGANVFLPRERDTQTHEVIADKDGSTNNSEVLLSGKDWTTTGTPGFAIGNPPYKKGENPFKLGTCLQVISANNRSNLCEWFPDIPEKGNYAVYISYQSFPKSTTSAYYRVYHTGGITEFKVNQQLGGGTWVYLGTFNFAKGKNRNTGKVILSGQTDQPGQIITADAVRFGGGMGNVARGSMETETDGDSLQTKIFLSKPSLHEIQPTISGKPRYLEGARYYLQYAGMPDSLVYNTERGTSDYNDDYRSRAYWVNYLMGGHETKQDSSQYKGLGIPIDLSFALHSDAGATSNAIIGTLAIYSSEATSGVFPDGQSRTVSHDLADMIQTQIVSDIRATITPQWTRRGLWNKQYSEVYRPNVPAALIEILSHQNFADMKYGNDPHFKFIASRAIYKAMTRFIARQNGTECVIQPLPVSHFRIVLHDEESVSLNWRPVADPLEPSAKAEKYKIYKRVGDKGFDNGIIVSDTTYVVSNLKPGDIYSFKVAALNEGGESLPSEILAVSLDASHHQPVLIVNGFNRISAPAMIDTPSFAGFVPFEDHGVPDHYDISFVGDQYDFDRNSVYKINDDPGFGASYGNMENLIIPGNTFDFVYVHGRAIRASGYPFISSSREAFEEGLLNAIPIKTVDLILGEQKTTNSPDGNSRFNIYTPQIEKEIARIAESGGNILVSGAYIGTDLKARPDTHATRFAEQVLHFKPLTGHAVKIGEVKIVNNLLGSAETFNFNTIYNPDVYTVESPDAIAPTGKNAFVFLRYNENTKCAGVAYIGGYKSVSVGFPLETITDNSKMNAFFVHVFRFFEKDIKPN